MRDHTKKVAGEVCDMVVHYCSSTSSDGRRGRTRARGREELVERKDTGGSCPTEASYKRIGPLRGEFRICWETTAQFERIAVDHMASASPRSIAHQKTQSLGMKQWRGAHDTRTRAPLALALTLRDERFDIIIADCRDTASESELIASQMVWN